MGNSSHCTFEHVASIPSSYYCLLLSITHVYYVHCITISVYNLQYYLIVILQTIILYLSRTGVQYVVPIPYILGL